MNYNLDAVSSSRLVEDDEEFFESLEEILSTSSSDSSQEGMLSDKHLQLSVDGLQSQLWYSGHEIWTRDLGAIPERRQRLLIEMGLDYRGEDESSGPLGHSSSTESVVELCCMSASSMTPIQPSPKGAIGENLECHMALNLNKALNCSRNTSSEVFPWSITRSKSDGSFSELKGVIDGDDGPTRLVKSGTNSPLLSKSGSPFGAPLLEQKAAVPRSGAAVNMPADRASKPPLTGKRTARAVSKLNSSTANMSGTASCREQARLNNSSRETVTRVGKTSQNVEAHRHGTFLQGSQKGIEYEEVEICTGETGDADKLCRIKNLDNGKEFIVDRLGQDGLWKKLRELDTGRELTWEEFETSLGLSPIMQEVIRRERAEDNEVKESQVSERPGVHKKKRGILKFMKWVVSGMKDRGVQSSYGSGSDEREGSTEKGGRRSDSTTDDSQEIVPQQRFKRVKVHSHKKPAKEFSELHLMQEFQAHQGAIWTMKFSSDGLYLASAGQDRIVLVWDVVDRAVGGESPDVSEDLILESRKTPSVNGTADSQIQTEAGRSSKVYGGKKKSHFHRHQPSKLFFLSEKPRCSFQGHTEEILDLSWSQSQLLLSSSMDKTVRLWHASKKECLSIFAHHDYVTCIQFNPLDDEYFISGSLDNKVRIWSVKHHQVVDWIDLREMVTAACYKPDGQGAVVGTYKGTCRLYKLSGNKLQLEAYIDVQGSKSKKSRGKKITGFQFIPGEDWKFLVTSSDSRIRVYNHTEIIHKYKGFRNANSQISASFSPDRKYILCASEDSHVYIWNHMDYPSGQTGRWKEKSGSYEYFCSQNVLVALPWPGLQPGLKITGSHSSVEILSSSGETANKECSLPSQTSSSHLKPDLGVHLHSKVQPKHPLRSNDNCFKPLKVDDNFSHISGSDVPILAGTCAEESSGGSLHLQCIPGGNHSLYFENKGAATWPEENLPTNLQAFSRITALESKESDLSSHVDKERNLSLDIDKGGINMNIISTTTTWGLVIVTASLSGEIRVFQNYT